MFGKATGRTRQSGSVFGDRNPRDKSLFGDEQETKGATFALAKDIDALQDRLYAEGKRALLVVLQGTDTAGKDGTIRSVFNATGPLGVSSRLRPAERGGAGARFSSGASTSPARGAAPSASSTARTTRTC